MSPDFECDAVIVDAADGEEHKEEHLIYKEETYKEQPCCDPTVLSEMESGCFDTAIAGLSQVRMEHTLGGSASSGGASSLDEYKRFKQMAAELVIQKKEEDLVRSMILGDENTVNQDDSVECVTGSFLEEITGETVTYGRTTAERNAIHAITVGELFLKLEV